MIKKFIPIFFLGLMPNMALAKDWRLSADASQSGQSSSKFDIASPELDALGAGRIGVFVGETQYPQVKGTKKEQVRARDLGLSLGHTIPITPYFNYLSTLKVGHTQAPEVRNLSDQRKYWFTAIDTGFSLASPRKEGDSWLSGLSLETGIGWQVNWIDRDEVMTIATTMVEDDFFYPYLRLHLEL